MNIFIDLKDDRSENVSYDNTEYPIYVRRSCLSSYPNYAAPSHWHDDIEFTIILDGSMEYNVNGNIIELKSQEGILVNSRQMHFGFSKTHKECDFICVLLHPMMLCLTPDIEQNYIVPVVQNTTIPYIHFTDMKWHKDIMDGIHKIYDLKNAAATALKTQSIFSWIWALIYENMPHSNGEKEKHNNDLSTLKKMISFIQQHYCEKISLEQIALSGNVGQSKCCKLFHVYIHQTPNAYLNGYRLNKSTELLLMSDLNIAEIAYEVGFSGASYYAEAFRKCFGISPSEYRQNLFSVSSVQMSH